MAVGRDPLIDPLKTHKQMPLLRNVFLSTLHGLYGEALTPHPMVDLEPGEDKRVAHVVRSETKAGTPSVPSGAVAFGASQLKVFSDRLTAAPAG